MSGFNRLGWSDPFVTTVEGWRDFRTPGPVVAPQQAAGWHNTEQVTEATVCIMVAHSAPKRDTVKTMLAGQ